MNPTLLSSITTLYLIASIPLSLWLHSKGKLTKTWCIVAIALNIPINAALYWAYGGKSFLYSAGIAAIALLFCLPGKKEEVANEQMKK
ncbi:MAG: hypothetical protein LBR81_05885 [Prevotellaceae bacterium]|jgi:hypothetical protein|nr:hypothetical protein [Prevotellaceae bacterium]